MVCWRDSFLSVLTTGSPAQAIGALGFGTENIMRTVYGAFALAIERIEGLHPRDTVFFPLHVGVVNPHHATLEAVSADFACSPEGRSGLRRGMIKALTLRVCAAG